MVKGSATHAQEGFNGIWTRVSRRAVARVARGLLFVIGLTAPMLAAAQEYPNRPIRLVVAFAAGSATDTIARIFGQKMSVLLGQQIIVDNRPGAVGLIGADLVAKATPDGYTLLVGTNSTIAARALMKSVPFDAEKDFTPISFMGVLPQVVVVNNDLPFKTLPDMLSHARANPGKLSYSWSNSVTRVATEMLGAMSKVKFYNVSYKVSTVALADVISGQINFTIVDMILGLPQIKAGRVRALAVTTRQRVPTMLPDVPTVAEAANLPGYELVGIFAAFGPAKIPAEVISKLNAAIVKAGDDPEVRSRLGSLGLNVETSTPQQLRARFRAETATWTKVATEAGIEPQ